MTNQDHQTPDPTANVDHKIRRLATKDNLIAHKSRKDGKWYFADINNILISPEQGLDELEAVDFLTQE